MNNFRSIYEHSLVAFLHHSTLQLTFFTIQENVLVEHSGFCNRLARNKHIGPANALNFFVGVVGSVTLLIELAFDEIADRERWEIMERPAITPVILLKVASIYRFQSMRFGIIVKLLDCIVKQQSVRVKEQ